MCHEFKWHPRDLAALEMDEWTYFMNGIDQVRQAHRDAERKSHG